MKKERAMEVFRTALRVFLYQIVFGFFGFMLTPALIGMAPGIRIPLIGVLILGAAMLMFSDGSYRGERDCGMSETLDRLAKTGNYHASLQEEAKRYWAMKGLLGAFFGMLPLLLVAMYVAIFAEPYAYTLQDLPTWMSAYTRRPEIGDALRYIENLTVSTPAVTYLRVVVRFVLFPYVGLLGEMTDAMSLLFDRISPLLVLVLPTLTGIGYLFGPSRRAKNVKAIEEAKRTPRKRLKKEAKRRLQEKEKKQLI